MKIINKSMMGIVKMEFVLSSYYTAVTVHMIIFSILLGIHIQSVVDNPSVNQLMVIRFINVMSAEVTLEEIAI